MYTNLKIYDGTGVGDETMSSKNQAGNVNDQWQTKLMSNRMYNVFFSQPAQNVRHYYYGEMQVTDSEWNVQNVRHYESSALTMACTLRFLRSVYVWPVPTNTIG